MAKYLTIEQLKTNLILGKPVEQWLSHEEKDDYRVLKWLRIDKEKDLSYSATYFECFDDGNADFTDIYEFSLLDPDGPEIVNVFTSIDDILDIVKVAYEASIEKFVPAGMIQEEYKLYLSRI